MVRALFVAGHRDVILDETNLYPEDLRFWTCSAKTSTPTDGGNNYPALLAADEMDHAATAIKGATIRPGHAEADIADELQGDVIAWKRHVIVFRTSLDECERRAATAADLMNYNQRCTLLGYIRTLKHPDPWKPEFVQDPTLLGPEDSYDFVGP